MWQCVFWSCLCWFGEPKIGHKYANNSRFGPLDSKKSNLGTLTLWWDIPNDSLRSYMIETDLPVCVLICLDIYHGLQKEKFVLEQAKKCCQDQIKTHTGRSVSIIWPLSVDWIAFWRFLEIGFLEFRGPNQLFFAYVSPIFGPGNQHKHLNRSKHTLTHISFYHIWHLKVNCDVSAQN